MASEAKRPVKIVKRREPDLVLVQNGTPLPTPQTPAQIRREMVSTIVSWINDRKRTQPACNGVVTQTRAEET